MAFFKYIIAFFLLFNCSISISSDLLDLSGEAIEGGLMFGHTQPNAKVYLDNKNIMLSSQGDFVIGFHRDEKKTALLRVELENGSELSRTLHIKQREYAIERIDGLPQSKVSPTSARVLKRIKEDIKAAKNARKLRDQRLDYQTGFIWPAKGRISGFYGSQRILNGIPKRPHFGVDIANKTGTFIIAPAAGVVTLAHPDMYYSGGTLILDHGQGLSSSFLHLSKLLVKVGDIIKQGQIIALMGASGRVTGPHLDWRMNWMNKRIDPQLLVPKMEFVTGE